MSDLGATGARSARGREALRFWTPVLLAVLGAAGILAGFLLAGVCARFSVDRYGQVSCVPLLDETTGAVIVLTALVVLGAGLYLIFFNRRETFDHVCAECGKRYQDGSAESVRRARGRMACSAECAEKIEERARLTELEAKVAALAAMALRSPPGVERMRARERLAEIAAYANEPVRSRAREALQQMDAT